MLTSTSGVNMTSILASGVNFGCPWHDLCIISCKWCQLQVYLKQLEAHCPHLPSVPMRCPVCGHSCMNISHTVTIPYPYVLPIPYPCVHSLSLSLSALCTCYAPAAPFNSGSSDHHPLVLIIHLILHVS